MSAAREVPEMAMRHDDLTEEQLELKRSYERSWEAAQETLADPEKRAWLEANIERVKGSTATPISSEEFLAMTESSKPAE
ncbi:MAG: hypothetical protein WKF50_14245 [Nocardioides sp.]